MVLGRRAPHAAVECGPGALPAIPSTWAAGVLKQKRAFPAGPRPAAIDRRPRAAAARTRHSMGSTTSTPLWFPAGSTTDVVVTVSEAPRGASKVTRTVRSSRGVAAVPDCPPEAV